MSNTTDTPDTQAMLDSTLDKFKAELETLRPQHEAFVQLERIVANFDRIASGQSIGGGSGSGSRAGRGSRPAEFLTVIEAAGDEGITVAEAAEKMNGMNSNYLYRLSKDLTESGQIIKKGKRYFAVATADAPEPESTETD